jgi:hypothetical protein
LSLLLSVYGEPREIIKHHRGLRQGDPLSPMLFILVMDTLDSLILKAQERGLLLHVLRHGNGQRISLYADDVVLFLQPSRREITLIKEILRIFGEASGLKTNVSKCSMTPIQCNDLCVDEAQSFLFPLRKCLEVHFWKLLIKLLISCQAGRLL